MELPTSFPAVMGLGNPGPAYARTYHNAGFIAVHSISNELARETGSAPEWRKRRHFRYKRYRGMVLAETLVHMNESGLAVAEALAWLKLRPEQMLVIHDDSDIALGAFKISFGRNSAGHRGVESAIQALGTNRFFRARLGVRAKPGKAEAFVLKRITSGDEKLLQGAIEELTKKVITKA